MNHGRDLFGYALWVALAGAAAGCGAPAEVAPAVLVQQLGSQDAGKAEEAVRALARQGAADPERVVPLLIARLVELNELHAAVAARITPDLSSVSDAEARNEALIALVRGVQRRLAGAGFSVGQVRQEGSAVEVYVLPPADPSLLPFVRATLVAELSRTGDFTLRAEVPAPFATTPERPVSPWQGDAASYTDWLAEERARFAASGSGGADAPAAAYVPTRSDVGLVPVAPGPETGGLTSVALRLPGADGLELSGDDLSPGLRDDPVYGTPALYLVPREGREAHVRAFFAAHAGLTLWLVSEGRALLPARLPGKPGLAITFPVHGETPSKARARVAALVDRLALGRHPFPVTVALIARPSVIDAGDALCRSLVRIGPAAEPALEALAAKDPSFGPLVEKLREGILQMRTE